MVGASPVAPAKGVWPFDCLIIPGFTAPSQEEEEDMSTNKTPPHGVQVRDGTRYLVWQACDASVRPVRLKPSP